MATANVSSEEETSPPKPTRDIKQKKSILDYFKKEKKPQSQEEEVIKPQSQDKNVIKPQSQEEDAAMGSSSSKKDKAGSSNRTKRPSGSSSEEYSEDWPRPWRASDEGEDMEVNNSSKENKDTTPESNGKKGKLKKKKPRLWKRFSEKDTEDYRSGYPGKKDNSRLRENRDFYFNEMASRPRGDYIDKIHSGWYGNHGLLEEHHGYIQWLFPIREQGMNFYAQELQLHEAKAIRSDPTARERVKKSYKLMLDFYGIQMKNDETGELERAENWRPRFRHLNRSMHNYLRITRILKSLGELGYEHYKAPFVEFIITEALEQQTLMNCIDSCMDYWVNTVKDDVQRAKLKQLASAYYDD